MSSPILKPFIIPIRGLKIGIHTYEFDIDDAFFKLYESSIEKAKFNVSLEVDKSYDFYHLTFDIEGTLNTECDRCLAEINLPIQETYSIMLKLSAEHQDDDAEIIYITSDDTEFSVANLVYDYIMLSLPYNNVYDCENDEEPPCDFDALDRLEKEEYNEEKEEPNEIPKSIWDDLKGKLKED
jgi:uncharacterized protein